MPAVMRLAEVQRELLQAQQRAGTLPTPRRLAQAITAALALLDDVSSCGADDDSDAIQFAEDVLRRWYQHEVDATGSAEGSGAS